MAALLSIGGQRRYTVGRPKMADGEARVAVLFVRVTPAQKEQLERRAGELGLSVSVLVRDTLRLFLSSNDASSSSAPVAEGVGEEEASSR